MFKIAIIIPTYNRANQLARALDSVLAQSYQATEIIVVDDGSCDNTAHLIKTHYPQIRYLYQAHRGVSAARNHGIARAHCDWICLLDSDDSWASDKLAKQQQALIANPDYLFCHTNETWYRQGNIVPQKKKHQKKAVISFNIGCHCVPYRHHP